MSYRVTLNRDSTATLSDDTAHLMVLPDPGTARDLLVALDAALGRCAACDCDVFLDAVGVCADCGPFCNDCRVPAVCEAS